MARPREQEELLTEVFKVRLSKKQNETLDYLAGLNHISKGQFLRKIIDQTTKTGSSVRVINRLTRPVLAHKRILHELRVLDMDMHRLAWRTDPSDPVIAQEIRDTIAEAKKAIEYTRKYVIDEL